MNESNDCTIILLLLYFISWNIEVKVSSETKNKFEKKILKNIITRQSYECRENCYLGAFTLTTLLVNMNDFPAKDRGSSLHWNEVPSLGTC